MPPKTICLIILLFPPFLFTQSQASSPVTPVLTGLTFPVSLRLAPTGIATVAPNVYYFGEYNTGNLVRLELTPTRSIVSTNQVYTQNGGIIALEMEPNGKLYYTSPDAIYTYQIESTAPSPAPTALDPTLILIGIAILIIVALTVAYSITRRTKTKASYDS